MEGLIQDDIYVELLEVLEVSVCLPNLSKDCVHRVREGVADLGASEERLIDTAVCGDVTGAIRITRVYRVSVSVARHVGPGPHYAEEEDLGMHAGSCRNLSELSSCNSEAKHPNRPSLMPSTL